MHPKTHPACILLPLLLENVEAGFPSPAADYYEEALDLIERIAPNPAATFVVRAAGASMEPLIYERDYLVLDRSLTPRRDHIIVADVNGERTIKRVGALHGRFALLADNPLFDPIVAGPGIDIRAWGVATWILRKL